LYKQTAPLHAEGLVIKLREHRITYVYLTKAGAKWKPEKEKKSKKEKKKEKKEKKEKVEVVSRTPEEIKELSKTIATDIKNKIRFRVKQITRLEHELKGATEERKKEIKDEIGVMEIQLSRFKREVPMEEAEKKLKAPEEKKVIEVHPQVEKKIIAEVSTQELRAVKVGKAQLKDLVNEFLMNIVVRKVDSQKYGMSSARYKSYLLKMIEILAKSDASWLKHNIRIEKRQILTD